MLEPQPARFGLLSGTIPASRAWHGALYGTAVWLVADELVLPLLGLSRGPRQLPATVHAYALAGHWVFGLTLDSTMRAWA